jgi:hypothetical protein
MSSSSVKVLSLVRMVTFGETSYSALHFLTGFCSEAFSTGTTMLFSFIVLALSADYVSLVPVSTYNHFAALALFTALTTLLTVTPMYDRTSAVVGCIAEYHLFPLRT